MSAPCTPYCKTCNRPMPEPEVVTPSQALQLNAQYEAARRAYAEERKAAE